MKFFGKKNDKNDSSMREGENLSSSNEKEFNEKELILLQKEIEQNQLDIKKSEEILTTQKSEDKELARRLKQKEFILKKKLQDYLEIKRRVQNNSINIDLKKERLRSIETELTELEFKFKDNNYPDVDTLNIELKEVNRVTGKVIQHFSDLENKLKNFKLPYVENFRVEQIKLREKIESKRSSFKETLAVELSQIHQEIKKVEELRSSEKRRINEKIDQEENILKEERSRLHKEHKELLNKSEEEIHTLKKQRTEKIQNIAKRIKEEKTELEAKIDKKTRQLKELKESYKAELQHIYSEFLENEKRLKNQISALEESISLERESHITKYDQELKRFLSYKKSCEKEIKELKEKLNDARVIKLDKESQLLDSKRDLSSLREERNKYKQEQKLITEDIIELQEQQQALAKQISGIQISNEQSEHDLKNKEISVEALKRSIKSKKNRVEILKSGKTKTQELMVLAEDKKRKLLLEETALITKLNVEKNDLKETCEVIKSLNQKNVDLKKEISLKEEGLKEIINEDLKMKVQIENLKKENSLKEEEVIGLNGRLKCFLTKLNSKEKSFDYLNQVKIELDSEIKYLNSQISQQEATKQDLTNDLNQLNLIVDQKKDIAKGLKADLEVGELAISKSKMDIDALEKENIFTKLEIEALENNFNQSNIELKNIKGEKERKESENQKLKDQLELLSKNQKDREEEVKDLQSSVETLSTEGKGLNNELISLREAKTKFDVEITNLETNISELTIINISSKDEVSFLEKQLLLLEEKQNQATLQLEKANLEREQFASKQKELIEKIAAHKDQLRKSLEESHMAEFRRNYERSELDKIEQEFLDFDLPVEASADVLQNSDPNTEKDAFSEVSVEAEVQLLLSENKEMDNLIKDFHEKLEQSELFSESVGLDLKDRNLIITGYENYSSRPKIFKHLREIKLSLRKKYSSQGFNISIDVIPFESGHKFSLKIASKTLSKVLSNTSEAIVSGI